MKINGRLKHLLHKNDGTSLVLVTIIAIIIVTGIVILRVTTSSLWASADKQIYQDQAYMMAVSLGDSIDKEIQSGNLSFSQINGFDDTAHVNSIIPNSGVKVTVSELSNGYTIVTVSSHVAEANYDYVLTYYKVGSSYVRKY